MNEFFQRMKVKTRIYLIAGFLLFLIVSMGSFAITQVSQIKVQFIDYSEKAVPAEFYILKITADTNYVSRLNRSIILGGNYSNDFASLKQRIEQIYDHYNSLEQLGESWSNDASAQELQALINEAYGNTRTVVSWTPMHFW